ncbi:MAG: TonB-dependent receptor [Gemmatimonadota bacterium]|nr:MAG: TonB-dependent receptor [Gemmatimonadota bacterium]
MKIGKLFLSFLVFALMPGVVFGGVTGKIAGVVKDKDSGDPLPGANIVVEGTTMGAATNLNGEYFILNVPPGTYVLKASMVGYNSMSWTNVAVSVDLTTTVNFELNPTIIEFEAVTVTAERPMIQKDITSSTEIIPAVAIERTPTDQVEDLVSYQAGVVDGHFRGGRTGEAVYMLDGSPLMDPYTGNFDSNVPELGVEETVVMTGGYGAEYANAQSGIVNFVAKEGTPKWAGKVRLKTSDWGLDELDENEYFYRKDEMKIPGTGHVEGHEKMRRMEFNLSGPEPISSYLFKSLPGKMNFVVSGDINYYDGRFPYSDHKEKNILGKVTYKPAPAYKVSVSGLKSWDDYNTFMVRPFGDTYNLYRRTTYEDLLEDYGYFDPAGWDSTANQWVEVVPQARDGVFLDQNGNPWFDNGQLDTEDVGRDGIPGTGDEGEGDGRVQDYEDLDGDGYLDTEDLDHNGVLNGYRDAGGNLHGGHNMLDHIPVAERTTDQLAVTWSHTLSPSTFYEFKIDRYHTFFLSQINERAHEWDVNLNGRLDANEDLNGNGVFDPYGTDLFRDENNNYYIDASEIGPPPFEDLNGDGFWDRQSEPESEEKSNWIEYANTPFGNSRDVDDFYKYGDGTTYYRDRWMESEKTVTTVSLDVTSQVNTRHQLKTGMEMQWYDIYNFEIDMASGGNTYNERFRVYPRGGAIYIQDKMEFEGMIVNAGMRYDFFHANYNNYPSDLTDPTPDPIDGGSIKNPTSVKTKDYWSPRLGVSHPITERDKLYFSYGRYFQIPRLDYLFRNINYNLQGAFPLIGNPNLTPERTTSYELGVEHLFPYLDESLKMTVKGFYKDIIGLTDTRSVFYTADNWYGLTINTDYGNVRGFEISLVKRPTYYVSGTVNYTYQLARGKSSGFFQGYLIAWAENIEPTVEWPLDWDQPHTFNLNLDLRIPENDDFLGLSFLNNTGINLFFTYGSGLPYTEEQRTKEIRNNTERRPSTYRTDMKIDKGFAFGRFKPMFFLEVKNLFNKKNMSNIDEVGWYDSQDSNNDGVPDNDPEGKYEAKYVWDPRRIVRAGLMLSF